MATHPDISGQSEHSLQLEVLRHLRTYGRRDLNWFAIPNAGKRSLRYGARMKSEGMQSGVADICIMLERGRVAWLELKTRRGYQTDEQHGFEAKCLRLGHPYCLARTLDEAVGFLRSMGVLRGRAA
jgi:hypothetical protein